MYTSKVYHKRGKYSNQSVTRLTVLMPGKETEGDRLQMGVARRMLLLPWGEKSVMGQQ